MMKQITDRQGATFALLQQLSIGLSAYRLFPDDPEQQAFVGAVQRVRAVAERALRDGTVDVEIHGERFRTQEGSLPEDEALSRLARGCYERRAERLRIRATPDRQDLGALYRVLTTPVEEVLGGAGAGAMLREAGVTSIVLSEVEPLAVDPGVTEDLTPEQAETWERLQHGEALASAVEKRTGDTSAEEHADSIYGRLRGLVEALPEDVRDDPDLYLRLYKSVTALPDAIRQALESKLVDNAGSETVAERIVGSMTDAELAKVLVDVSDGAGGDPVALARQVAGKGARKNDLPQLTEALARGQIEGGTIVPAPDSAMRRVEEAAQGVVSRAVSDLLARELAAREREDAVGIQGDFPDSDMDLRSVAFDALRDYLIIEEDLGRLEAVLDLWAQHIREALGRKDADGAVELVKLVRSAATATAGDRERQVLFDAYGRRVVDPSLIAPLIGSMTQGEADSVRALLAPLGATAVDALLDLLGEESDRTRRAAMIGLLADLAESHRPLVAGRLKDSRWYVARNAVTVLYRSGAGRESVGLLEPAIRHAHPAVRREGVLAIASALGTDAVPYLRSLTMDRDESVRDLAVSTLGGLVSPRAVTALVQVVRSGRDTHIRLKAIAVLGSHPSPEATRALQDLTSFRARARLPRVLRRQAKKLFRQRKGGRS